MNKALVVTVGLWAASCAQDNRPEAPAMCKEAPTTLVSWFRVGSSVDSCDNPIALTGPAFRARGGVVYFGAGDSVCIADASGVRPLASTMLPGHLSWGFVDGLWLYGDSVVFTDGYGVYSVPIAGGEVATLFPFTVDDLPFEGAYDFDGAFVYWGAGVAPSSIFRQAITGGASQAIASDGGFTVASIQVAGDRLDFTEALVSGGIGPLRRMPVGAGATTGAAAASVDLSTSGALLASTGNLSYVRYARAPGSGFDDSNLALGVVDSSAKVQSAWTGDLPQLMPTAASVQAGTLYAGGRLHYRGDETFLGVGAVLVGAASGRVIGCFPTVLDAHSVWPVVLATAADETGTYALVDRPSPGGVDYAIVRFPAGQ